MFLLLAIFFRRTSYILLASFLVVSSLLSNKHFTMSARGVVIWGYPINDIVEDKDAYLNLPPSQSIGETTEKYGICITWKEQDKPDYFNFKIKTTEGAFGEGLSGAPVFYIIWESKKLIFGGMVILAMVVDKDIFAIRPEVIIGELKKLL